MPDYNRLNTARTNASSRIDFRIDKKWFARKITWNLYFDVQNLTSNAVVKPTLVLDRPLDANKKPIGNAPTFTDANGNLRYKTKVIDDTQGNATPSIGLQVEF